MMASVTSAVPAVPPTSRVRWPAVVTSIAASTPPGVLEPAEVIQHQRAAGDGADRVTDTAAGDVRSGTVHGGVKRYRYRGSNIPTPGLPHQATTGPTSAAQFPGVDDG